MATQCRGTKTKRINRHKLAVIQAYIIIGTLVLIGFIGGLVVGRATAPKKQVTVTETVEVPSYEADSLPVAEEVTYFDVPLSHSLQRYIYEVCADENVPVSLIIAMIDQESKFNPEVVSKTGDYGLMQINTINHEWLAEEYRTADMLDPYQNVFCGIKVIGSYIQNYNDYGLALMAYNMGDYGAKKAWENGIKSTSYSESVLLFCPVNMRPFTPWHLEIDVNKNFEGYNGVSFEKAVNAFEIYNCTDNETGRYTAFYIPVVTVDRFTGETPTAYTLGTVKQYDYSVMEG